MSEPFYYKQNCSTDNPIALVKNLLYYLQIPFAGQAVEQALYEHTAFPFISLNHLLELMGAWNLRATPCIINPENLQDMRYPAIALLEKETPAYVLLCGCQHGQLNYIHPAAGWLTEPVNTFAENCLDVVIGISVPETLPVPAVCPKPVPVQRAAIALTLVNADKTLESFIQYHLAIGFEHIFLFFDQPGDAGIETANKYRQVTCLVRDTALALRWKTGRLYKQFAEKLEQPEARQLLNMEIAIQLALEKQIDWLLQIDIDELFYSPVQSVAEHFTFLATGQISHITYPNYEAVSHQLEIGDYFREVSLFKRNPAHLSAKQQNILKQYTSASVNPAFVAYSNGKSAARVETALLPWGNHLFQLRKGNTSYQKKYVPDLKKYAGLEFPVILHYAECGFDHFWQKYKTWGNFPDTFLGGQPIVDHVPFRIASRDVVAKDDIEQARRFYAGKVLMQDTNTITALLAEELLCEIKGPSAILKSLSKHTNHTQTVNPER
jgi:hypothetical protein